LAVLVVVSSPTGALDVASSTSVTGAPTKVAHTADGSIAYRVLGRGSPIVMITGFGASMDEWAPAFINQLARAHKVVLVDNAGVGRTTALPAPLSITAMSDQISALMTYLRLGRSAVLGWSMGGLIAQALAVTHRVQVSRLVLAATQAGTGTALPVPAAAAATLTSGTPGQVLALLFPADQTKALQSYVKGILTYRHFYLALPAAKAQQNVAIAQWFAGAVPAGQAVRRLRLPTLVADGTEDALDPVANDHQLAGLIRGAQLTLYPDAGHGFLFQDAPAFVARIDRFMG
jgi:pimeloyl-ACP methyl ester carboxylesterase